MNPKWALATVPKPVEKPKEKSIKQQEQIDLYNALKKVNGRF